MSKGKRMSFIQNVWVAAFSKMNSIPSSRARPGRLESPRALWFGVIASSTLKRASPMATRGIFCPRPTVEVGSCGRGDEPVGEGIKVREAMVGEGKRVLFCPRPTVEVGSCRRGDAPVGEVIEVDEAMVSEGRIGWSPA